VGQAAGPTAQRVDALGHAALGSGCRSSTAGDAHVGVIVLRLSTGNMFEGGTGCHEWQAGHFLAEYVLSNPALVEGRRCLELGCGAGLVGVALHRAGASQVVCTDGNLQTLDNCRANLELNAVPLAAAAGAGAAADGGAQSAICCGAADAGSACAVVQQLEWESGWSPGAGGGPPAPVPDVIVGADLLYDPLIIPVLLRLLQQILQHPRREAYTGERGASSAAPPEVVLCTLRRNEASMAAFLAAVAAEPALEMDDISSAARRSVREGVKFCHLQALEAPWDSLLVHRLRLAGV
jgi:predicted nicotinamide N-methyase